jgi:SAM-dependent methyltransferase
MTEQSDEWSRAARRYEEEFIDPELAGGRNPVRSVLAALAGRTHRTVADLGCGTGPLLPFLARHYPSVLAIDFAAGMLERSRERCAGLANVAFHHRSLTDLKGLGPADVAVAVNSYVMPDLDDLERALASACDVLRPGGTFLGIVPAVDSVHYLTMLLMDRARETGMPAGAARKNAAMHAEHELYQFDFGEFRYKGLVQHFWQPFEVPYRLKRAGFHKVRVRKVPLPWQQFRLGAELASQPPPWDWYFQAEKK